MWESYSSGGGRESGAAAAARAGPLRAKSEDCPPDSARQDGCGRKVTDSLHGTSVRFVRHAVRFARGTARRARLVSSTTGVSCPAAPSLDAGPAAHGGARMLQGTVTFSDE